MEKIGTWDKNTVISELTQGRELANELKKQLHPINNPKGSSNFLLEKILSSYDNALSLLNCMVLLQGNEEQIRSDGSDPDSKDQVHIGVSKKRKTLLPRWSEQVRVCSGTGTGFDGQHDDGYNWRKYGQKDILGSNHPRAYYRCTHRNTQGCLATKQVQRADEDPLIFEVIYKGHHTCFQERLKRNKENHDIIQKKEHNMISNEPEHEVVNQVSKEESISSFSFLPTAPMEEFSKPGTNYSPQFSPPESYFSLSPCQANEFELAQSFHSSDSNVAEIISNPNQATNSSFEDLDFLIDEVGFDSYIFNQ